ncbi:MAG: sporulation protein YabP [Firmicutes bacterium HGW-Firmicutes-8]|nr:MAG: sporulation protein YabP [Firmicutes bacterium HGW-Firmicutes-8]
MNGRDESPEYKIVMTNRKHAVIEGVENVESFDDEEILLETKMGTLIFKGQNLHIVQLNLDNGTLTIEGHCKSVDFTDEKSAKGIKGKGKGIIQRILR